MKNIKQFVTDHKVPVAIISTAAVSGAVAGIAIVVLKQDANKMLSYYSAANDALEKLALGAGVTGDAITLAVHEAATAVVAA